MKLADFELVLAFSDTVLVMVCLLYPLCLSVFVNCNSVDKGEVKMKHKKTVALLRSNSSASSARDIRAVSKPLRTFTEDD